MGEKAMKNIVIIAGGDSSEYEVSLRSAAGLYGFMDKTRYHVFIACLHGKEWKLAADYAEGKAFADCHWAEIDKNDFSAAVDGKKLTFDYAYITIHGTPGENGVLQGYLEMIGLPYSCCGVLAAALTFDKYTCNHYLHAFGINIAHSILLREGQSISDEEVMAQVGLPCFIKSNVGGSSFGCTKVKTREQIQPAIQTAFKEGPEVIIEAFMKGREVTCGVYKTAKRAVAFPVTEVVTSNEFFDYDAKYNGQVDEITPAPIPAGLFKALQELTLHIYDIIGCKGIIRTDYILVPTDEADDPDKHIVDGYRIMLLEVNTTPGMTATSFIPQQVRAAGLDIKDVLTHIIEND